MTAYGEDALSLLREAEERMLTAAETRAPGHALVLAVDALRLTLLALAEERDGPSRPPDPGSWCRVELFGHSVTHGLVREVDAYGRRWLEVTVPAGCDLDASIPSEGPGSTPEDMKRYHPNAVYALQEVGEERVLDVLRRQRGLHKWRDGTWHDAREGYSVELDLDALSDRPRPDDESDDDDLD